MGGLAGKVAIITGAAGGIGAASARRLAEGGVALVLSDADAQRAQQLAHELGEAASALEHDVTNEQHWQRVVAHALEVHGRVDVLLNNAGVFLARALTDTSPEEFRRVLDVNVLGVFLGMRAVAPAMIERRAGSVINLSSVAGLTGAPLLTAYSASKFAVRGMSKTAAKELACFGIRVNSLHPGQIDTDMNARQREETPELVERLIKGIPLGRIGTPEDVAELAAFLASDKAAFCTGGDYLVDGGLLAGI
ncbi:MAG TPA: glucose 1-dehydrogenase, partial [Solirubrobacteraceae bacterium]|nr:glucose 1-dehydrogenase [Solirubrobacteraceae bacterium]